jgi:hypothetical protein
LLDIGVDLSVQVRDILAYACGLILGLALISPKNPNFEMASKKQPIYRAHSRAGRRLSSRRIGQHGDK